MKQNHLETPFAWEMGKIPFSEYPRPQMRRGDWMNLNGEWDFSVTNGKKERFRGSILVPFPVESPLSGVGLRLKRGDRLFYERVFSLSLPEEGRVLLHFGAVDQICTVYLNEKKVGENRGGYLPFTLDITEALTEGENRLRVEAVDELDRDLPYGKQTKRPHGMWYTPVSGIWQTVWLEKVPEAYIDSLKIQTDTRGMTLSFSGEGKKVLTVKTEKGPVTQFFYGDSVRFEPEDPRLWSPEEPYLYTFTLTWGKDRVESYFGLREIGIQRVKGKAFLTLNQKPYFFHGLLDQGYYPDGLFLPATERGWQGDLFTAKACGFNMLRKHIKLEPEVFYYYCDKYGIAVFQDMINSGPYSFLLDTALPTLFLKKGISHRATKKRREEFFRCCRGILRQLYNHPSVLYYTIFNEGWGQFDADEAYEALKSEDPSRIFDTFSGWFRETKSDVQSEHIYFKAPKLTPEGDKPLVLSEYGGFSHQVEGHIFRADKNWGYGKFDSPKALEEALAELLEHGVGGEIHKGLSAAVLTQLSDVEEETNGLLTYDRAVLKVDPAAMKQAAEALFAEHKKQTRE